MVDNFRSAAFGLAFLTLASSALAQNAAPLSPTITDLDWDRALLEESLEVPDVEEAPIEFDEFVAQHRKTFEAFDALIRSWPTLRSDQLPIERIRKTANSMTLRAWRELDDCRTSTAYLDCLTLIQLAKNLKKCQTPEASLLSVSVVGMVAFPTGRGIDKGWTDEQLLSLQRHLLTLRPLSDYLAVTSTDDPELREVVSEWSFGRNSFKDATGELPDGKTWNLINDLGCVDMRMRQIIISLALEHHRREHGEFPDRLEKTSPESCPSLPRNLWAGTNFTYQRTGKDDATLGGRDENDFFVVRHRCEQRR